MGRQLYRLGWFVGVLLLSIPATVRAEVQEEQENSALAITQVESVQAEGVQAEVAQGTVVQITAVRLNSTVDGLEVILETLDGQALSPTTSVTGNALIADIPNAVLALSDGNEFQQANPIEGIALVSVTALLDNRVRVAITGTEAPPTAEVRSVAQGLVLSVAPGTEAAETDEDAIQVVVTGEQGEGYAVNEATTTRLDIPLRDNPRSIQVIPRQVLEDQSAVRVGDALQNVSGVVQSGGFGGTADQYSIRGFSDFLLFRDGFRDPTGGIVELSNVERVEVLRGPASILVGNIEPGGVINVVTEQPLDYPYYAADIQVGSYGFLRPTFDLSGPLTDSGNLRYRLNLAYQRSDGFRDVDQNVERFFVAPVLAWDISDRTTLTVDFSYLNSERPLDRGFVAIGRDIADLPIDRFLGEPDDFLETEEISAGYRFEHRFSDRWRIRNAFRVIAANILDYRAEPIALDETTGILTRNFRSNDDFSDSYTLQTELSGNFTTGFLNHTLLLGVDLARRTFNGSQNRLPDGLTPSINIFDPEYNQISRPDLDDLTVSARDGIDRTDSLGIFLQDLISITDNLKVLLAGRFEVFENEFLDRDNFGMTSGQTLDAFSPTIGLVYQPIEPLSIYANYARSFQPNFGTGADGAFLEPERGTQYEIGLRGELLNGRLVANLAAFNIEKSNVATVDPDNPDFSIPAGNQRSRGIELDVIGEILPGWNVIASYGHLDAEVTESNDRPIGSRIQNVPRNTASLWTTYEIQDGDFQGLGFGFGLFYVGERAGDFSDTFDLPDYLRTDAALFYRRDNWRAAINIQNLFDVEYFRSNDFGRAAIEPGAPLTIIGSVSVEF
jgi:iron complex outermembrane receptor protein